MANLSIGMKQLRIFVFLFSVAFSAILSPQETASAQSHSNTTATDMSTSVTYTRFLTESTHYGVTVLGNVNPINKELQIENTGDMTVAVQVALNNLNTASLDAMLASILSDGMTPAEKAMAIYNFGVTMQYHWWPATFGDDLHDPVKLFNVYGYGFCDDSAVALSALFERAGLPARLWHLRDGEHIVAEAYYEGRWHMFDADRLGLYLLRDNETVAGVLDLIADPGLVQRAGPGHADLVEIYAKTAPTQYYAASLGYRTGHQIVLKLAPEDTFAYSWEPPIQYHDDSGWNEATPPFYTNAQLITHFNPSRPGYRAHLLNETNVRASASDGLWPFLSPVTTTMGAEIELEVESPFPFVQNLANLNYIRQQITDSIEISVSTELPSISYGHYQLLNRHYQTPDFFVQEHNIATQSTDGLWPALHSTTQWETSFLEFKVKRRTGHSLLVGGWFFRDSSADQLSVSISRDGNLWTSVWEPSAEQFGYFEESIDLSALVHENETVLVRYTFFPVAYPTAAGVMRLDLSGLAPFNFRPVLTLSSSEATGTISEEYNFSSEIVPPQSEATYQYVLRIAMRAFDAWTDVGIQTIILTNTVQLAPFLRPELQLGSNLVSLKISDALANSVKLTHRWQEVWDQSMPSAPAPLAPSDEAILDLSKVISFSWQPSFDPDGDPVRAYHIQICDRADCRWPVSPVFSKVFTPDVLTWQFPFNDWLQPEKTYYWRLRALDSSERYWSEYSAIRSFVAKSSLPSTALYLPFVSNN